MPYTDWRFYALGSAVFASLTAILGKVGVAGLPSNLATLVRTVVILFFAAALVTVRHEWRPLENKATLFLVLSGLATGASWLCYYRALQLGPASKVAPLDKLSVALTIVLAIVFLGESLTWKTALGGVLIVTGSLVLAF